MIPTQLVKTGSMSEAIENTFSGSHPCSLCAAAAQLRDIEQDEPSDSTPNPQSKKDLELKLLPLPTSPARSRALSLRQGSYGNQQTGFWQSVFLELESPPPQSLA